MSPLSKPVLHFLLTLVCLFLFVTIKNGAVASSDNKPEYADQLDAIVTMPADADYGEYLAGACLACHSPTGTDSIPRIHGAKKAYLAQALLEYKHKHRENSVMQGVAAALNDEDIAALVAYFSVN